MGLLFSTTDNTAAKPETPLKYTEVSPSSTPVIILYSYIGTGYHGLQYCDTGHIAVENFLFDALSRAKLITGGSSNRGALHWNQASRTDCGVHAAAQVLSFLVHLPVGGKIRDLPSIINSQMSNDSPIHVIAAASCTKAFNAQKYAEARNYLYLMPLSAFREQTEEHLEKVRKECLPLFIGTKNYHNYTKRITPTSPSAIRTILDFTVSSPFKLHGKQFVLFKIYGKSFMMNQIRKMLSSVLSFSHGLLNVEDIKRTFTEERWALSKVPGDGLLLDKVEYTSTRARLGSECNQASKDPEFTSYRDEVERWKTNILYPHISKLMIDNNIYSQWLKCVLYEFPPCPQSDPRSNRKNRNSKQ